MKRRGGAVRGLVFGALASLVTASALGAQAPTAPCDDAAPLLSSGDREYCVAIAQAVQAAQPQLGILLAGGSPTLGSAALGRIRLRGLPRFSASVQASAAGVRLPDIGEPSTASVGELSLAAPVLSGSLAVGLFPGVSLTPTVGGVGSLDLLGSAAWLPFRTLRVDRFDRDAAEFGWGVGGRLGLLRESFGVPAASVSLMYRRVGRIRYGEVCPSGAGADLLGIAADGYRLRTGLCTSRADPGEFAFDLTNWSGRATIGKRLGRFGLDAGAGYDRFRSNVGFGLGATANLPSLGPQPVYVRASDLRVNSNRWSVFGGASYNLLFTAISAEAGWMQGGQAVPGFDDSASAFDPGRGTLFGSLGLRFGG